MAYLAPRKSFDIMALYKSDYYYYYYSYCLVVWHSGSALVSINEVILRQVRVALRWVTVCGTFIAVCNQPPGSTQPGHPFVGRCYEYQPKGGDAPCGWGVSPGYLATHGRYLVVLEMLYYKVRYEFTLLYLFCLLTFLVYVMMMMTLWL